MIKLIVGLGNPGSQYEKTRHNAGFLVLDRVSSNLFGCWRLESRFNSEVSEINASGCKVLLQKPVTFMNKSGDAVAKLARYYKISPDEILVVHDELDFESGVARLKKAGGHAGHNGLRDIIQKIGSRDFYRLRIGIGRPSQGKDVANYVLSTATTSELKVIQDIADCVEALLPEIARGDMERVMTEFNSRGK